ncbi:hypothetical protein IT417_04025 [bacterium]|nr:hypothetical protein [bacterium]
MGKNKLSMFVIFAVGFVLLWLVDWQVAIGSMMMLWANNIDFNIIRKNKD